MIELVFSFALLLEDCQSGQVVHFQVQFWLFHGALHRLARRCEPEFLFLVELRERVELTVAQGPKVFHC